MKARIMSPFAREPEPTNQPQRVLLPLFSTSVPAGFPSPATEYLEEQLDLNEYIFRHPSATFCWYVRDDAMQGDGIGPGDLLVIDRSVTPCDGDVVLAVSEGEFVVRRWEQQVNAFWLVAATSTYQSIPTYPDCGVEILGVVTFRIRQHPAGHHNEAEQTEHKLDLNSLLVKHRAATFLVRVEGDSMIGHGIFPNDILVVDKRLRPSDGDVALLVLDGDFAVKQLEINPLGMWLESSNPRYPAIEIAPDRDGFEVWGKVTYSIHKQLDHVRSSGRKLVLRELREGL
jgi:DNA polymerase V